MIAILGINAYYGDPPSGKPCCETGASAVCLQPVMWLGFAVGNFCRDFVEGLSAAAVGSFLKVVFSQNRGELFTHRRTDKLIDGDAVLLRNILIFAMQGFRESYGN